MCRGLGHLQGQAGGPGVHIGGPWGPAGENEDRDQSGGPPCTDERIVSTFG